MKITHVVLSLDCGGLEQLVIQLAAQLHHEGVESDIVCLQNAGVLAEVAQAKNVRVTVLGKAEGRQWGLPFRLAHFLKKNQTDVVHTHNMPPLIYGSIAARMAGLPCLNTRHGRGEKRAPAWIWALNRYVVSVSQDAHQTMIQINRIAKHRQAVVYNGIAMPDAAVSWSPQQKERFKNEHGIAVSSGVMATVGRLSEEKDQLTLLKAFAELIQNGRDVHLLLIGDGQERQKLEAYVQEQGLTKRVSFLGYRDDVHQILSVVEIFVLSSLMEGIPLALLEAMAVGIVPVVTNVGGHPEVIASGQNGLLVPVQSVSGLVEACQKLLDTPSLMSSMSAKAQMTVEKGFNAAKMTKDYLKLYRHMLQ